MHGIQIVPRLRLGLELWVWVRVRVRIRVRVRVGEERWVCDGCTKYK